MRRFEFNNQVIDLKALTARLTELKQTNPDIAVVIRPDRDLPVQKLIALMDALKQAQITKVGIATKAEVEVDVEDPAVLAKRHANCACPCRVDRRTNSLERSSSKRARCGKLGLVEWRARSSGRKIRGPCGGAHGDFSPIR